MHFLNTRMYLLFKTSGLGWIEYLGSLFSSSSRGSVTKRLTQKCLLCNWDVWGPTVIAIHSVHSIQKHTHVLSFVQTRIHVNCSFLVDTVCVPHSHGLKLQLLKDRGFSLKCSALEEPVAFRTPWVPYAAVNTSAGSQEGRRAGSGFGGVGH